MKVAGFGFTSRATQASLADALRQTGCAHSVTHLATAADKAASLATLAADTGCALIALAPSDLADIDTPTQSPAAHAARNTGSLAEAAALAAAGPQARLIVTRCISSDRMATCAIAQGAPT